MNEPEKFPKKIASANIFSAEILWKMGEEVRKRVIMVPTIIDDPRYSDLTNHWPKSVKRMNGKVEEIIAVNPDLAIIATFHSVDMRALLTSVGIQILTLSDFSGFDAYRNNIRLIAGALGVTGNGEKLIMQFEKKLEKLKEQAKKSKNYNKFTISSFLYGNTMGSHSTFHDSVTAAGAINLASRMGIAGHKKISLEELQVWNPDLIVISCGMVSCKKAEENFKKLSGIKSMKAFQKNGIISIPSSTITSTNERMLTVSQLVLEKINKL